MSIIILWYAIDAIGGIFKFTTFQHKDFIKLIIPPTLHYMLTKSMLKYIYHDYNLFICLEMRISILMHLLIYFNELQQL
jgi:hypothetical protein